MFGLTKKTEEPCAWHTPLSELIEEESYGTCQDCADAMELQSKQRQFSRVPSYVERFRDEKKYSDKYGIRTTVI